MPPTGLASDDLQAVVAYLETLRVSSPHLRPGACSNARNRELEQDLARTPPDLSAGSRSTDHKSIGTPLHRHRVRLLRARRHPGRH